MHDSPRRDRTTRLLKAITIPTALALSAVMVAGCGSRDSDTASGTNAKSCVDTFPPHRTSTTRSSAVSFSR